MRPDRIIQFDEVLAISAMKNSEDGERVKESVRRILDLNYDIDTMDETLQKEEEIVKRTQHIRNAGPRLM